MTGQAERPRRQRRSCGDARKRGHRAAPHDDDRVVTVEQQHELDQIALRIDQQYIATEPQLASPPPSTGIIPVRLTALGLLTIGVTGIVAGLARSDLVLVTVVGIGPTLVATILLTVAGRTGQPPGPDGDKPERDIARHTQLWLWLTTCAHSGCGNQPTYLGWCSEHAPPADHGPDEP